MIRIVIDIELEHNLTGTKEAVAMALEHLGRIRVVSISDGKTDKAMSGGAPRDI